MLSRFITDVIYTDNDQEIGGTHSISVGNCYHKLVRISVASRSSKFCQLCASLSGSRDLIYDEWSG